MLSLSMTGRKLKLTPKMAAQLRNASGDLDEEKMLEIIKGGATTLLVSHSLDQIRRMATKVLWLEKGEQVAFGETKEICDRYQAFLNGK